MILFRDGLEVEGEMLQRAWHLPLRKLVLGDADDAVIVAAAARVLIGLSWTESFLLGALLSPTDPVLTSSIVTNPRVPRLVRHSLNLESGLNDGLALPAVLAFARRSKSSSTASSGGASCCRTSVSGSSSESPAAGSPRCCCRARAARRRRFRSRRTRSRCSRLGVAFATYGVTVLSPKGNGFIAVFVAAIVLGVRRPDARVHFERNAEEIVEIVKLGIFFVFGSLLTLHAFTREGWAALALVAVVFLIARPLAVWLALAGTRTDAATRLFMGWFGPKGVATMTFALIVLDGHVTAGSRIFDLTALVVFCSIVVHGVSDTPGAEWIARRAERRHASLTRSSGRVQRSLLLRRGKSPRGARAALLAKDEAQLLRRAQLRLVGAERRARLGQVESTEEVAPEIAFVAADLLRRPLALRSARHSLPPATIGLNGRQASKHRRREPDGG